MAFNIDKYAYCFEAAPNEAYFWHGRTTEMIAEINDDGYAVAYNILHGDDNNAMRIAKENGGKTLEMCMLEHRGELEKAGVKFKDDFKNGVIKTEIFYGNTAEENNKFFEICSQSYADQASGVVYVIEGTDPRTINDSKIEEIDFDRNVWARIEHPTLTARDNEKVSHIISIDAVSGKEQEIIFDRAMLQSKERHAKRVEMDKKYLNELQEKEKQLMAKGIRNKEIERLKVQAKTQIQREIEQLKEFEKMAAKTAKDPKVIKSLKPLPEEPQRKFKRIIREK